MKIKTETISYDKALELKPYKNQKPVKQGLFWRWLLRTASMQELKKVQYYCFPKNKNAIVAKARLATEELYRLSRNKTSESRRKQIQD